MSAGTQVDVAQLTEIRARRPEAIDDAWAGRERRPLLGVDGRLLIIAADHPARGALGVRGSAMAMKPAQKIPNRPARIR